MLQEQKIVLSDIRPLEKFTNLEKLQLCRIDPPQENIPKWMKLLVKFGIYNLKNRYSIDLYPIKNLSNLQKLDIDDMPIKNIKPLASLINLKELALKTADVSDIKPLKNLTNLQNLCLLEINISNINQ